MKKEYDYVIFVQNEHVTKIGDEGRNLQRFGTKLCQAQLDIYSESQLEVMLLLNFPVKSQLELGEIRFCSHNLQFKMLSYVQLDVNRLVVNCE